MSRSASRFVRLLGPLSVAAALGISAMPAMAQTAPATTTSTVGDCSSINFQLANPSPGAFVEPGTDVVQGIAVDSRAPSGQNGIDRVDFFLGNRDEGGISIGTAVPGMVPGPFGAGSFQTTISLPSNMIGGHDLFAYAHDTVTGQESIISEPIALGEDVSKAFVTPPSDSATMTCTPATGLMTTTTMVTTPATTTTAPTTTVPTTTTTVPTTTTTTTTTTTSPTAQTITLDVGNPSPGDTIHAGGYAIQGMAFDKAATSGSGISMIQLFLDSRDQGGVLLGEAVMGQNNMWSATVSLPNNNLGLHELWFYATSSVTGQTMAVSVPVTIAP